ncbi:hypothetical protein EYM_07655 [Ignicoccus islandicus DSM 13165]|uniref:Cobalamin-independent methionine synthase MetE N-terminal domain-containing protein n=1 Tax=Ignicoccus islandicus DSM 13165 TaxID=940295 RepID=A0A0U3FTJ5_9CREN|nr:hypothetical protein [Ignicoccus islandicus]ALU12800.1 hypothetical protein EYM_07655 [Ignicoccus islandicus DSM 13165]
MKTKILTSHSGGYPRPPEWRKSIDAYQAGKIDYKALMRNWELQTSSVIFEQMEENIDILTSGNLFWDDLFRPFAKAWDGMELPEVGGYYRFYELNFYYKRAIVNGEIRPTYPVLYHEQKLLKELNGRSSKVVVPGPLTFALHVENKYYPNIKSLLRDITLALATELEMVKDFVDYIQVDEPALVDPEVNDELKGLAIHFINELSALTDEKKIIVKTYFKPATDIYHLIEDLEVSGIGFDAVSWNYEDMKETVSEYGYPFDVLDLGIGDALNVRLEPVEETVGKVIGLMDEIKVKELHISHNYRLDLLPYSHIRKKLRRLSEIVINLRRRILEEVE